MAKTKKENTLRMQRCIAEKIILAQVASDGGKGIALIDKIFGEYSKKVWWKGYGAKNSLICEAIRDIHKSQKLRQPQMFHYSVAEADEFGDAVIIYFTFKLDGVRRQVSFHSFDPYLFPAPDNRHKVRWDRKSSREAVIDLAKHFWVLDLE